jgi:hypothetical protein
MRITSVIFAATLVVLATCAQGAGEGISREYQVKAAFIYNFTQFIEWPVESFATRDAPLVVAVVGSETFTTALQQAFAGKQVANRPVNIRLIAAGDEIKACHVLVVPAAEGKSERDIVSRFGGRTTLTIGESEGFTAAGGGIRFYGENNKIRFEINPDATGKARLKVSSKLLKLAKISTQ